MQMTLQQDHPVAIIGAGPVGLAAAARLAREGLAFKVYEVGASVAASVRDWGHVRLFSPWRYNVDAAARALLEAEGWVMPDEDVIPTGAELSALYLEPLARIPALRQHVETNARVTGITRLGLDKVVSAGRENAPFVLHVADGSGRTRRVLARAVIDASGTWGRFNPLGAGGLPAEGEAENADRICYRIPDISGADRSDYESARTLVVGAGHSAANAILDLLRLESAAPITWAIRAERPSRLYGGKRADGLPARGALGDRLAQAVDDGQVTLVTRFSITSVSRDARGSLTVTSADGRSLGPFDRIIATTGQRPDLALTRELRLDLDPWLESARALGPMIDPNLHSCGSVRPHGHRELSHPEPGFYIVGMKSYGRAPTFLMMTGYEQVRSITAALTGDRAGADDVRLILPETGVCSTDRIDDAPARSCCGKAA
jgi:thioredoxin reductase